MCLKDVLTTEKYHHFLLLHTSIYILASDFTKNRELIDMASSLANEFVEKIPQLYYKEFVVFNVHSLTHLADDVQLHGALDNFSAFPFENFMQIIKRMLRSKNAPLAQVVRRLSEIDSVPPKFSAQKLNSSLTRFFCNETQPKSYPIYCKQLGIGYAHKLGILQKLDPTILSRKCILLPCKKKYFFVSLCNSYEINHT